MPVVFDAAGVRFADNEVVSAKQLADANKQLATALKDAGLTLRAAQHRVADDGAEGSVQGDGFYLGLNLNNQSTVYTIAGWLGSGFADGRPRPRRGGRPPASATPRTPTCWCPPRVAPERATASPGATRARSLPAQARDPRPAVTAPVVTGGPTAGPVAEARPRFALTAATAQAQAAPASGGRDPNDYDRETVLALFAIMQFLASPAWRPGD